VYSIDIFNNFVDYELILSIETDDFKEAFKVAKEQTKEGLSVVVMSHKSGCEAYIWPDGTTEIHAGNEFNNGKEMEVWF
jgi:hypothetical protein